MDIEPIVGKDRLAIHHQHHRQIIPVAEALCSLEHFVRRQWIQRMDKFTQRHGRHKVPTVILKLLTACTPPGHAVDSAVTVLDTLDLHPLHCLGALTFDQASAPVPHHPRTKAGIVKLLDQRGQRRPVYSVLRPK